MTQSTPSSVMAGAPLSKFHVVLLACCSFIMFFDGYDLIVYGSVLPTLMKEWNLAPDQAGWLGSAALVGMMCGAVFLGSLADRIGRRPVILHGTLLFSIAAVLTGFSTGPEMFGILRFATGVFLGGVIPNIVSLMNELAPAAKRHTMTTIMLSMYSVGSIAATLVAIWILPLLSWHAVFFVSGISLWRSRSCTRKCRNRWSSSRAVASRPPPASSSTGPVPALIFPLLLGLPDVKPGGVL